MLRRLGELSFMNRSAYLFEFECIRVCTSIYVYVCVLFTLRVLNSAFELKKKT